MLAKIAIKIIKAYQFVSKRFLRQSCRFYPTCSQYTIEAIKKYGFWRGCAKGAMRISKCHPWHPGGIDLP